MVGDVHQINENREHAGKSWMAEIVDFSDGGMWLRIRDTNNDVIAPLERGERIHFHGYDMPNNDGDYIVQDGEGGTYFVEKLAEK